MVQSINGGVSSGRRKRAGIEHSTDAILMTQEYVCHAAFSVLLSHPVPSRCCRRRRRRARFIRHAAPTAIRIAAEAQRCMAECHVGRYLAGAKEEEDEEASCARRPRVCCSLERALPLGGIITEPRKPGPRLDTDIADIAFSLSLALFLSRPLIYLATCLSFCIFGKTARR